MFNETPNIHAIDASLATAFTGAGAMAGMAFMQAGNAAAVPHDVWPSLFDPALGPAGGLAGAVCGLVAYSVYWAVRHVANRSLRRQG
ncbi:hypothetical protein [Chitinasiproducens palmae]|uniref:Uncharacterized protein n=1 Tax=Chitinasiproducens palmae TaxID=1770053 RepID=A0A1H2PQN4_9BURK|nr:hypothetical protein [Chitinasiproducens palmae]SDV49098.1 hypothetical protein SAMN05216551_10767 [Chitinasiproducens palmae]